MTPEPPELEIAHTFKTALELFESQTSSKKQQGKLSNFDKRRGDESC